MMTSLWLATTTPSEKTTEKKKKKRIVLAWVWIAAGVHFQRLYFLLGFTILFTTQLKTQKYKYQYIFRSYGTIYTFKNYFATVFSTINFQFSTNKQYPNTPLIPYKILQFLLQLFYMSNCNDLSIIFTYTYYFFSIIYILSYQCNTNCNILHNLRIFY